MLKLAFRAALRAMPWLVTAGAVAFGSWYFRAMIAIIPGHDRLAAALISVILFRATAAIAAISLGSFALAAGLDGRWFSRDARWRRRFAGLAALGGATMGVGAFIIVGRMAGFSNATSLGMLGAAGILTALSAWSTWSLLRRREDRVEPKELRAPDPINAWVANDLGRVKTPAN